MQVYYPSAFGNISRSTGNGRLFCRRVQTRVRARLPGGNGARFEAAMKTQGELEAAICDGMTRFEQEHMGRGPKDIRAHLIGDLLVVRLQGVLTAAEQQLVKSVTPVEWSPWAVRGTAGVQR